MRRRIASKLSTALVVIMALGGVLMGVVITQTGTSLLMDASTSRLSQESKVVSIRLQDIFEAMQRDVKFLIGSPAVRRVINPGAAGVTPEQAKAQLQEVFAALLNNHPWYVQARLIGQADGGRELVRVDQINGQIIRVPNAELQRKGDRKYFRDTLLQPPGSVYISAINLNREDGEIAEPQQAVLRVAMPLIQDNGTRFGALVINVDAQRVFDAARDVVSPGVTLYVANQDGYYLYHPDPARTFGFDLARPYRIQDNFPAAAGLLSAAGGESLGEAKSPGAAEAVVAHLSVLHLQPGSGRVLLLALTMPSSVIVGEVNAARRQSASLILPFLLVGSALVVWMVRLFIGPLERVTREMRRFEPGMRRQRLPEENRRDEIGQLAQVYSRMAERIERQVSELKEQRKRFQSLFETAADAILIIDQDGTIEYCNSATERLFGYTTDELLSEDVRMLMPDPDRSRHREYMRRYLDGGEPHIIGIGREVSGVRKDGNLLRLYLSIGEFTLEGRRKFTGILHDISAG
jgi:PAS domain S-box-containing protein